MKALDHMIKEDLYHYSTDTWGGGDRTLNYNSMKDVNGQVNYKDEIFVVTHESGGGAGMGAYPESVSILRIKPIEKVIKPDVEPTKVVIIESEAGWGQRVDEIKEFDIRRDAEEFVSKFNEDNDPTKPTPNWYMYAYIDEKA